jgi:FlaA1/EpsC-like NDP-sugar epimerase
LQINGRGSSVTPRLNGSITPRWWSAIAGRSVRGLPDLALMALDVVLVATAFALMVVLRYELDVPGDEWGGFLRFLPVAVVVQLVVNRIAGLYGPVWQQASILEAQRILAAGLGSATVLTAWVWLDDRLVPLSVSLTGGLVATGLMGVLRFQSRLFGFYRRQQGEVTRVLVVGAGESGGAILREIARQPDAAVRVVGLVDDDARKRGRWMGNTPIAGGIDDLVEVGHRLEAQQVLLAIPSADSALVRRVADATSELGVPLKVLPSVTELMNGNPRLRDVRDLSIHDLLGRQPIDTDLAPVQNLIRDKRVLVTGGGGSIGSEIVRQVAAYHPASLVVLDRDETHLFDAMAEIGGRGIPALVDVRDREGLLALFEAERPEIVFHAAANKHVPLMEAHPREAVATNVLGTENLVHAARETGVDRVVFISTDKAVNPANVMGASKRLGEQLVLTGAPEGAAWCAVRFGNVLGSRGSVVPTFVKQIQKGGPVTLTHEDVTRFFMSIPEAVQLVLQAATLAHDREVFMLEMGEPVRIMDLAKRMISLAGYRVGADMQIEVTGLRPGEKLAEELCTPQEEAHATVNPKIVELNPPLLREDVLREALQRLAEGVFTRDVVALRALLFDTACRDPESATQGQILRLPVPIRLRLTPDQARLEALPFRPDRETMS